jgi:raffinose/stachyose/melibiose transport system permease protein
MTSAARTKGTKGTKGTRVARPVGRTLLYITLILVAFISLVPVLVVVSTALKSNTELSLNPLGAPQHWLFSNFVDAWNQAKIGQYALNSLQVTVPTLLLVLVSSTFAGYAFAYLKFAGKRIIFACFLVGLMIPAVSIVTSLSFVEQGLGLYNTLPGLVFAETALALPLAIFIMRSAFMDLPGELREAVFVDGGGEFRALTAVMAPLTRPALSAVAVLTFLSAWNDYLLPLVLINTESSRTIPLGLAFLKSAYVSNVVLIAAATTLAAIPSLLIYMLLQRQFIDGIAQGSVK